MPSNNMPIFSRKTEAKTKGFQNNCLLNAAAVHHIVKNLKNDNTLDTLPIYSWLATFNAYYGTDINLSRAKELFTVTYPNPIDHETILGPVLREYLKNLLSTNRQVRDTLYNNPSYSFIKSLKSYLTAKDDETAEGSLSGLALPALINHDFLRSTRKKHTQLCNRKKIPENARSSEKIIADFFSAKASNGMSNEATCKKYWNETGFNKYIEYVGTPYKALNIKDAEILFQALSISVHNVIKFVDKGEERFVTSRDDSVIVENSLAETTVYNENSHWVYAETDAAALTVHNNFYEHKQDEIELSKLNNVLSVPDDVEIVSHLLKTTVRAAINSAPVAATTETVRPAAPLKRAQTESSFSRKEPLHTEPKAEKQSSTEPVEQIPTKTVSHDSHLQNKLVKAEIVKAIEGKDEASITNNMNLDNRFSFFKTTHNKIFAAQITSADLNVDQRFKGHIDTLLKSDAYKNAETTLDKSAADYSDRVTALALQNYYIARALKR